MEDNQIFQTITMKNQKEAIKYKRQVLSNKTKKLKAKKEKVALSVERKGI